MIFAVHRTTQYLDTWLLQCQAARKTQQTKIKWKFHHCDDDHHENFDHHDDHDDRNNCDHDDSLVFSRRKNSKY